MQPYNFSESYSGKTITAKLTTNTGTTITDAGTVARHSVAFKIDGVDSIVDDRMTDADLEATFLRYLQLVKDEIDGKTEFDKRLEALGFTKDGQLGAPTGFGTYRGDDAGAAVKLHWDVVEPIENYIIQQASLADFSDAQELESGDITPFVVGVLPTGTYYFRIKAQMSGFTDSPWAVAFIAVP